MPDIQITVSPAVMGSSHRVGPDPTTLSSSHSVVSEAAGFRPTRSWKVDTGGSPRWRRAGMNSRLNRMDWGSVESSAERTRH